MKVLITGIRGFVGPHLAAELLDAGHSVTGLALTAGSLRVGSRRVPVTACDLTDAQKTLQVIKGLRFDAVVHLAGLSQTALGEKDPSPYFINNVLATLHLCRGIQEKKNRPVFLFVSTSMVYAGLNKKDRVFRESDETRPLNAYGSSKLAAEYVVRSFEPAFRRFTIVRPSNHTGPGQSQAFVSPALAVRIGTVKDGGSVRVGNLKSMRDFSDVRDIARAYRLMLEKKNASTLYTLGSGRLSAIKDIVSRLVSISGKTIRLKVDPGLVRKKDPGAMLMDATKVRKELGWRPEYALARTLADIYYHEKERMAFLPGHHHK